MTSNTLVPLVFWGNKPPTHRICSILHTPHSIITGCRDGHICLWKQTDGVFYPQRLLFGHSDCVNGLAAVESSSASENFISTSESGEICLWDSVDCKCVEFSRLPGKPTAVSSCNPCINGKLQPSVLCYGSFPEILILNSKTLQVTLTLAIKIFPDWISSACVLNTEEKENLTVVGLTHGGILKVWNYQSKAKHTLINEEESKHFGFSNSVYVTSCTSDKQLLLIVTSNSWYVCDSTDYSVLCQCSPKSNFQWAGGEFLYENIVVLWTRCGSFVKYSLPFNNLQEKQLYRAKLNTDSQLTLQPQSTSSFLSEHQCILPPAVIFKSKTNEIIIGDSSGAVSVFNTEYFIFDTELKVKMKSSFKNLWDNLQYKPNGIIDQLSSKSENLEGITATLYISTLCFLCCGKENGTIVVTPALKTFKAHLLNDKVIQRKGWPPHKTLRGHKKRVTSIVYPHQNAPSRYKKEHLVSGSDDFSILMWDIFTGAKLYSFHPHAGRVTQLIIPPDNCSRRVLTSVCSVGTDNSVALINLRDRKCMFLASCHSSPITEVKWRPLDDFLVVGCQNSCVYVWQMETGHLDRYV